MASSWLPRANIANPLATWCIARKSLLFLTSNHSNIMDRGSSLVDDQQMAIIYSVFALIAPVALLFIFSTFVEPASMTLEREVLRPSSCRHRIPNAKHHSHFVALPNELILDIIILATSSHGGPQFYNLLLVSQRVQDLTYAACIPRMTIRLAASQGLQSFHRWVQSHLELAADVRHMIILPTMPLSLYEERTICKDVIQACGGLVSLHCHIRTLDVAILGHNSVFAHAHLVRLTVAIGDETGLGRLRETANGRMLMNQLRYPLSVQQSREQ